MNEKNLVNASQQKDLKSEFHIDNYEIKELYIPAYELMKRTVFPISLILLTLILGPILILCPIAIVSNLLSGKLPILYIFLFCISLIVLISMWKAVEKKGLLIMRKATDNLTIKINSNTILFSSEGRYAIVDINNVKIIEKENGILLVFKRVNNQKVSNLRNSFIKIYYWYDCIPILESNFTREEIETIKYLITHKGL